MIRYLYMLQNDHHNMSSSHMSPYSYKGNKVLFFPHFSDEGAEAQRG